MEKIEYGDVNKFLVSTGLVLIGLSVAIPYFYLNEDFGLYLERDKIKLFTPSVQVLICEKQQIVTILQKYIPWTSLTLFVSGIAFLFFGLKRWFKRQKRIDEKEDLDIQKLKLEIQKLTPAETIEKVEKEIESDKIAQLRETQKAATPDNQRKSEVNDYLNIEERVINHFKKYRTTNFAILDNVKIGRFAVDILLESKTSSFADRIVEVKYAKNVLSYEMINNALNKLDQYVTYYSAVNKRKVRAVLLIVYSDDAVKDERQLRDFSQRIHSESSQFGGLSRLKWQFIKESDIEKYDIKEILHR